MFQGDSDDRNRMSLVDKSVYRIVNHLLKGAGIAGLKLSKTDMED